MVFIITNRTRDILMYTTDLRVAVKRLIDKTYDCTNSHVDAACALKLNNYRVWTKLKEADLLEAMLRLDKETD